MMHRKHNAAMLAIVVSASMLLGMVLYQHYAREEMEVLTISVGSAVLRVEAARTQEQLAAGLSHRRSLAVGHGMLFVFNHDGEHAMWMKDMNFPLDIVWIDSDGEVVHIAEGVPPDTYPQSFASPVPARYVLEVPASHTRDRIAIGDRVVFDRMMLE